MSEPTAGGALIGSVSSEHLKDPIKREDPIKIGEEVGNQNDPLALVVFPLKSICLGGCILDSTLAIHYMTLYVMSESVQKSLSQVPRKTS